MIHLSKDKLLYKTVPCRDYQRDGTCPRWRCHFAHGEEQRPKPDRSTVCKACFHGKPCAFAASASAPVGAPPASADAGAEMIHLSHDKLHFKTKLCRDYLQDGACPRWRCTFAHGAQELRPKPDWSRVCPLCLREQECPFAAAAQPAQPSEEEEEHPKLPVLEYAEPVQDACRILQEAVLALDWSAAATVHAYGSSVNGFGDATSDIDLVVLAPEDDVRRHLHLGRSSQEVALAFFHELVPLLQAQGCAFKEVVGARVPVLKLEHAGRDIDITFNNPLPLFNTKLLHAYASIDRRVVDLAQELRMWTRSHGAHGAVNGHLSSYAMNLMAIFYMQVRGLLPCLQQGADESAEYFTLDDGTPFNVAMMLDQVSVPTCEPKPLATSPATLEGGAAPSAGKAANKIGGWSADSDRTAGPSAAEAGVNFRDLARFYTSEFRWGESVVSVRLGKLLSVGGAAFHELGTRCKRVDPAEQESMLFIEDPLDRSRNLSCVLAAGSLGVLRAALRAAAYLAP